MKTIRMNWTCSMQTFTRILLARLICAENSKLTWLGTTDNSQLTLKTDSVINCEVQFLLCRSTTCVGKKICISYAISLVPPPQMEFSFIPWFSSSIHNQQCIISQLNVIQHYAILHIKQYLQHKTCLNGAPLITYLYTELSSRSYWKKQHVREVHKIRY
jgi:hypothetical protein